MSLTMHDPDLDDARRPIVVVRHRPPDRREIIAGMVALVALAVASAWWNSNTLIGAVQVAPWLVLLSRHFLGKGAPEQPPALAVFEDGIKLPTDRLAPDRPEWEPWSHGFYSWDEVSHCHWSRFHPGRLCVYLKAAKYRSDIFGPADGSGLTSAPMVLFHDIPKPQRAAVEAAIRKWGHWDD